MSYAATIPLEFPCSVKTLYEALLDLSSYPKWNTGMTRISYTGPMYAGLKYETTSEVLGKINRANVVVTELIPNNTIALESHTGIIAFEAIFKLHELDPNQSSVVCNLNFTFSSVIFNLARPVVEFNAQNRIRTDLETLRSLITAA
jgi:hypothetical protein